MKNFMKNLKSFALMRKRALLRRTPVYRHLKGTLPEGTDPLVILVKAMDNQNTKGDWYAVKKLDKLSTYFFWAETEEGFEFWSQVNREMRETI